MVAEIEGDGPICFLMLKGDLQLVLWAVDGGRWLGRRLNRDM